MRKFTFFFKSLLVATLLVGGANSAWADTTWTFKDNTAVWAANGVTLNGGNQYDEDAEATVSGGVTFTGTSGFVSTAKGIGFNAVGSTSNENISIVVPAGYKATVSVFSNTNRSVVGNFGGVTQTYNAGWASSTKEFNNKDGESPVTLYLYCDQNPGGNDQKKAPFLESITLTDVSSAVPHSWTAKAVATINTEKTTIKTYSSAADVDEGSNYTIVVDKVIEYDGNYYELSDAAFSTNVYGKEYTMGGADAEYEYTYVKVDNAVFYGEAEDIYSAGSGASKSTGSTVLSNGGGYYVSGQSDNLYASFAFDVPAAGWYEISVGMNNTNDKDRGFSYSIDDATVSETITVSKYSPHVQNIRYYLAEGNHTLRLNKTYSLTPIFDYVFVKSLPSISATIGAYRYASFSSENALDFTHVESLTAFIVTGTEDSKIAMQSVTGSVAANTGLVLKGNPGTYSIPVVATGTTYNSESNPKNYMFAVTSDYNLGTNPSGTNYVLTVQDEKVVFAPIGGTKAAVKKGQAALFLPSAIALVKVLNIVDDTATGVEAPEVAETVEDGVYYNLNGQQVTKDYKGIVIVNGKKFYNK